MLTNIIIVGYGLPDIETRCIESVIKNTYPGSYLLSYMDNYARDNVNESLTSVWNKIIKASANQYICLLNSDTVVHQNWLDKMLWAFSDGVVPKGVEVGFVGPSTNNCHSPQKDIPTYEEALQKGNSIAIMKEPISGFCLLFRKSLWESLNGFDERYQFYGAESDFIDRARTLGKSCVWVQGAFVWHQGEASIKKSGMNVQKEREKARKLYWLTRKR